MKETLELLAEDNHNIQETIIQLNDLELLDQAREPGKWTPRQIIAHLCDVETIQNIRIMEMLTKDKPSMVAFSADDWASAGDYAKRDPMLAAQTFAALRKRNLELWSDLTVEQNARQATHPTRGVFSIAEWLAFIAKHDANHLAQLQATLEANQ